MVSFAKLPCIRSAALASMLLCNTPATFPLSLTSNRHWLFALPQISRLLVLIWCGCLCVVHTVLSIKFISTTHFCFLFFATTVLDAVAIKWTVPLHSTLFASTDWAWMLDNVHSKNYASLICSEKFHKEPVWLHSCKTNEPQQASTVWVESLTKESQEKAEYSRCFGR